LARFWPEWILGSIWGFKLGLELEPEVEIRANMIWAEHGHRERDKGENIVIPPLYVCAVCALRAFCGAMNDSISDGRGLFVRTMTMTMLTTRFNELARMELNGINHIR
jgi:hypothetical protein